MKTIKLYQTNALINQRNIDDLIYVDRVSSDDYMEIIFRAKGYTPLYSFWYYRYSDNLDLGLATNNRDLDIKVAPVKKVTKQIMVTKYIEVD